MLKSLIQECLLTQDMIHLTQLALSNHRYLSPALVHEKRMELQIWQEKETLLKQEIIKEHETLSDIDAFLFQQRNMFLGLDKP